MTRTTFAGFRQVLIDLGFEDRSKPAAYIRLEHPQTATVILLRPLNASDPVEPVVVLGYRRILDERGVIPANEFDERLRLQNAAG